VDFVYVTQSIKLHKNSALFITKIDKNWMSLVIMQNWSLFKQQFFTMCSIFASIGRFTKYHKFIIRWRHLDLCSSDRDLVVFMVSGYILNYTISMKIYKLHKVILVILCAYFCCCQYQVTVLTYYVIMS